MIEGDFFSLGRLKCLTSFLEIKARQTLLAFPPLFPLAFPFVTLIDTTTALGASV